MAYIRDDVTFRYYEALCAERSSLLGDIIKLERGDVQESIDNLRQRLASVEKRIESIKGMCPIVRQ